MRNLIFVSCVFLCMPSTVFGVAGVGDLSYDPAVHAELIGTAKILTDTYQSTIDFLDKATEINDTINRVYGAYEDVKNFDLKDYTAKYSNAFNRTDGDIGDKISAVRYGLSGTKGNLENDYDSINYQKKYIEDLRSLLNLDKAAKNNADKSGSANPGQAEVINSQNTSILTILAVDDAAARKEREAFEKMSRKKIHDVNKSQQEFDRGLYTILE